MCGICGIVGLSKPGTIVTMADAIAHRGPDADGFYRQDNVSLGHRRLSIVDVQHGQQPMADESGVVVVFNGEIYNHPLLQEELGAETPYQTNSDTETILRAYRKYGTKCVEELDGMFAFVLYDPQQQCLFGARDRLGKKPLYYTLRPFGDIQFAFASELKALRACPEIVSELKLSEEGMISYLLNDYVSSTLSIYDQIGQLAPGAAFQYGLAGSAQEGFRQWNYWERKIGPPAGGKRATPSYSQAGQTVIDLLTEAVERRFMSDVPVGVLLSGGIDSSTVVACAHRAGFRSLKTFSVGFQEDSFDETPYAAEVASLYNTEHFHRNFTSQDLVDRVPRLVQMMDEPFADPSVLPTSLLAELASGHVKTVLGGDGADELFAGYDPFKALAAARWYERLVPRFVSQHLVGPLVRCLPDSDRNMSLPFKLNRFLRGLHVARSDRIGIWMGAFSPQQLTELLPDFQGVGKHPFGSADKEADLDDVALALDFFQESYLVNDILVKVDRASMMHSLEVRTPFLDTRLVDYVNSLPSHFKYRRGTSKRLLKDAVLETGLLPERIVRRRKKGFGIPVARWMRVELHDYFRAQLLEELPNSLGMIDSRAIHKMWDEHTERKANRYKELWALFMMIQWARNVFETSARQPQPEARQQPADRPAMIGLPATATAAPAPTGRNRKAA
jgi:asparagine synthase (glutamine-hydrolysing)